MISIPTNKARQAPGGKWRRKLLRTSYGYYAASLKSVENLHKKHFIAPGGSPYKSLCQAFFRKLEEPLSLSAESEITPVLFFLLLFLWALLLPKEKVIVPAGATCQASALREMAAQALAHIEQLLRR